MTAPLSDPSAQPGQDHLPAVDAGVIPQSEGELQCPEERRHSLSVSTPLQDIQPLFAIRRWQALLVRNGRSKTEIGCGQQTVQIISQSCKRAVAEHLCLAGLRYVAQALLEGPNSISVKLDKGGSSQNAHAGPPTVESAAYLRDRVGVPRDLPLPAARQLRAHLNWFIESLHKG